jgi:F-type H+-transporting ATPase subunit gamma
MANLRDIRRRIKSVKNTAQITKAMQMVAAAKMRKAQQAALAGHPYSEVLDRVLVSLRDHVSEGAHALLEARPVKKRLVLLVTTDKGLCGALNTNILREAATLDASSTLFVSSGKKGASFLARTGREMIADFVLPDSPNFLQTKAISKFCLERFLSGEVDEVSVLYPKFVNTLTQKPTLVRMLPISADEAKGKGAAHHAEGGAQYLFEPDADGVLDAVLPYYFHFSVFQMILDARASEQSARMVAMKSATDNAKGLVKDLTLEYNKARQAGITTELLEITTAQLALA